MAKDMKKFPDKRTLKGLGSKEFSRKDLTNGFNENEDDKVSFSFRYFRQIANFGITGKNDVWMSGLLEQLHLLSEKNADELLLDKSTKTSLRMHPLSLETGKTALKKCDFDIIPEKYRPTAEDCPVMQFQISKANGRVIGFFNENHSVFYIVFLDPNHNAEFCRYNDYKLRKISPCESEIDNLMARIAKHASLNNVLMEEAEEFLLADDNAYFCLDKELVEPLFRMLEEGDFQSKLEEFLLSEI